MTLLGASAGLELYWFCRPGASSFLGLLLENGPLRITEEGSLRPNKFSRDKFVDYVWVDQCFIESRTEP